MKRFIPLLILIAGVAGAQAAAVSTNPDSLAAKRAACFLKHGQLMEKPALKNERACWYAHAYLMDRQ
jgi:hypothetical protein